MKKENLLFAAIIVVIAMMLFVDEETKHHNPFLVSLISSCIGGVIVGILLRHEC